MSLIYKHFIAKILQIIPLILLFYISLKDDSLFNHKFFDFFSLNFQYIIIYYWVLKNPQILGYGFIFLAGIFTDVIIGLPMGTSSLSYLVIASMAAYTRIVTVRISLITDWLTFIPSLLVANIIYFLILYLYDIPVNYLYLLISSFCTFLVYPFLWIIFELIRKITRGGANA